MSEYEYLSEIVGMCREAINTVPTNQSEDKTNTTKMFEQLRAIGVVCMDGSNLSQELKKLIPISKQGELHSVISMIAQTRMFSLDESAMVKARLLKLERILSDAAQKFKALSQTLPSDKTSTTTNHLSMDVFISHSSKDADIALALIELLRSAMHIPHDKIRCTSVDGYRLPGGAATDEQLKREVRESNYFIGLLTPTSLSSSYVLFELGARWGAQLPFVPLLSGGITAKDLPGPLAGINAHQGLSAAQLHQFVREVAAHLEKTLEPAAAYDKHLQKLISVGKSRGVKLSQNSDGPEGIEEKQQEHQSLAAPSTDVGREILELIQKEADPELRGITEIFDSPVSGHVAFLPNTKGSGGAMTMKARLFREAIQDLLTKSWLYPPEDDGKTRIYEYKEPV